MKVLYIPLENISSHKGSVVHVKDNGLRKLGHQVGLIACSRDKYDLELQARKIDHILRDWHKDC